MRSKPHWLARAAGALLMVGALLPFTAPGAALAHERRPVGPYTFVVGFATEPAIGNQPNGASVRVTKTDGGEAVTGAEKTLKVAVAAGGGQPKEFPLRAVFGQPGLYQADLIPTKAGSYIFTFTGTIDGTPVNQKFESGPGRFNDVESVEKLQFPDVLPAPAQLAVAAKSAEERAAAAESRVGQAQAFGIAGTILGALGLVVGAVALLSARRASATGERPAMSRPSPAGASPARP